MNVIPFNVPGLPEPEGLSSRFVFKPIAVDTSDPQAGPRIAHRPGARAGAASDWHGDGVLCIYPEIETIGHLFRASLHTRQREPVPAMVVSTQSTDGLCAIFGFGQNEDLPQLTVDILPAEHLPLILGRDGGAASIDLGRIDDRLEISQTFAFNSFGVISRVANDLVHAPKPETRRHGSKPIFTLNDAPSSIADVCSFYMSRELALAPVDDTYGGRALGANLMGGPDWVWQLLWKPAAVRCVAAFATVFVLTRLSISVRRARGETVFALDYNRRANWPDPPANE